ncbi:MAG: zf-HC2 domain-containing protein [Thermoanaerobaculia bacterium]
MHRETQTQPPFDESLLSGYLDGELTQGEAQRVRVHLEDHPESRRLFEEMAAMRDAALSTRLPVPDDDQWDPAPRGPFSRLSRRMGWLLVLVWGAATAVLAVRGWWTADAPWTVKAVGVLVVGGPLLLLLSVLADRLKVMKTDRYRRVQK